MTQNSRRYVRVTGPFAGRRLGVIDTPVQIYDLSEGGCFVNSTLEQPEGREFAMEVALPTEGTIRVVAQALYSRPGFGFAARFTRVDEVSQMSLVRELNRLRNAASGA
jgi:hypothetical protein